MIVDGLHPHLQVQLPVEFISAQLHLELLCLQLALVLQAHAFIVLRLVMFSKLFLVKEKGFNHLPQDTCVFVTIVYNQNHNLHVETHHQIGKFAFMLQTQYIANNVCRIQ